MNTESWLLLSFALLSTMVVLMPLARYLAVGWRAKRADILDGLNADSRAKYFAMFCRNEQVSRPDAGKRLDDMYCQSYGRRLFVAPTGLLFVVSLVSSYIAFGSVFRAQSPGDFISIDLNLDTTGVSAIAGAYLWVVDDFISRARRLDFSPADVHWAVLRLAVSVPMGYSFASIASPSVGPFVAFAVGAFPLATLTKMLRQLAAKKLGYDESGLAGVDSVIKLQGVNNSIADRLANEDITTVTQIAYCDPIRLTMRSNLTFNVVTDLMNQAIAWEYLDEGLNKLRPLGLRGAIEIKHLLDSMKDASSPDKQQRATQLVGEIALLLAQSDKAVLNAFEEIAQDPFTDYLYSIWV